MKEYVIQLDHLMTLEKPYLNQNVKISDVSNMINIPSKYISESINRIKGQNFYDYINGYRIKHVTRLLEEDNYEKLTLLAIAQESGFKSGSTFNSSFKKELGMLPSKYRKETLHKRTAL
ncbi:helix-turn-helix domain-containing protein [Winogradskyella sp. 3972H.M.0a.05]|uniref:helix-turn-helix domain-containing protein n=1 Tax=Winogradskyella sp. 3972H.M.0a.05 TaxID=2950277 RepID=UPI003390B00B